MKVTMIMVSSLDGKITRGDDPSIYKWTSLEDKSLFLSQIKKSDLIVMGRKTYDAARAIMKLSSKTRRVVITKNPEKHISEHVEGSLEFTDETPKELTVRMENKGYKKMLLVGGTAINTLFLDDNLVDEIHLTIEPYLFGTGQNLLANQASTTRLQLKTLKKLNKNGTLYLVYTVQN